MKSVAGEDTFEDGVIESGHRCFLDGSNVKTTIHGFQMADLNREGSFWKFDYGEWKNKQVYGNLNSYLRKRFFYHPLDPKITMSRTNLIFNISSV